ncbi:MAG: RluA family pseudouridine synthase [bacterium]|nr:RluA family pseudouridine synthase [bacterium]
MHEPSVIYEDKDFVVINKPAGLPVHAGGSIKSGTLVEWLIENYPEIKKIGDDPKIRPGIVHRLDKETSGVMVVARTEKGFETLKHLFKTRQTVKKYLTLVKGRIEKKSGVIETPIGTLKTHGVKRTVLQKHAKNIKAAVTAFRVLEKFSDATLVEVTPKTGRTHQIRVHFASISHPVFGDRLYGGKNIQIKGLERQFLHALSLSFSYSEGKRFKFEASLPIDLKEVLRELRKSR